MSSSDLSYNLAAGKASSRNSPCSPRTVTITCRQLPLYTRGSYWSPSTGRKYSVYVYYSLLFYQCIGSHQHTSQKFNWHLSLQKLKNYF